MKDDIKEPLVLDESCRVTLVELHHASGLSLSDIRELVEIGVLEARSDDATNWTFTSRSIQLARTARRLGNDFELDVSGMALALTYLERIRELEQRLKELECHMPSSR